ncbi:MAG: ABC transporter ATP-binding protein [Oscillospiraceae bacterium]|nr:ABC transporter ATP-binding protein [Oscillospiraceae bacterium]
MIETKNVTKTFDSFTALDNVSLSIPKGTAYGLIGSNGAGKSTLLRLLSGVYKAESGQVHIDGENVYDNAKVKARVFFINDETVQYNSYTLKELKNYYKLFYDNFSEDIFNKLHATLKLPMTKKISSFSKGMKRQAAVICGIACKTDYLLLDEAFDGLDPTMRIIVKKMLVDAMIDNDLTVLLSSHNLKEINEFCDRAGLIHQGKFVFDRELDNIKGNIHKIQTAFDKPITKEDFADIDILHIDITGSIVYIIARGDAGELRSKIDKHNPKIYDILPLTLEEIFVYEMEVLGYDYSGVTGE